MRDLEKNPDSTMDRTNRTTLLLLLAIVAIFLGSIAVSLLTAPEPTVVAPSPSYFHEVPTEQL